MASDNRCAIEEMTEDEIVARIKYEDAKDAEHQRRAYGFKLILAGMRLIQGKEAKGA